MSSKVMTKGPRGLAHQRVYTGPNLISLQTLKAYLHSRLILPFSHHTQLHTYNQWKTPPSWKHNQALIWLWLFRVCVSIFDVSNPVELRFSTNSFSHLWAAHSKLRLEIKVCSTNVLDIYFTNCMQKNPNSSRWIHSYDIGLKGK